MTGTTFKVGGDLTVQTFAAGDMGVDLDGRESPAGAAPLGFSGLDEDEFLRFQRSLTLWMLLRAAGGRIVVGPDVQREFRRGRVISYFEPQTDSMVFEAVDEPLARAET